MNITTHRIASQGIQLHAVAYGNTNNTPIVLVHGYPDNHRVWQAVAERLADKYYVITYDVRGAGESDAPTGVSDYKMALLAQDLAAVVDALIPGRRFHLAGHDWGSIQSWESVTTNHLKSRIASYTSISGPSLDHMAYLMRDKLKATSVRAKRELFTQLTSSWYILFFQLPGMAPALWRAGMGKWWPSFLEKREGVKEAGENPTQTDDGATGVKLYRANFQDKLLNPEPRYAHCPVQLIIPTKDNYVGDYLFEQIHRWVPELYRRELHASHWVPLSHPTLIADWIDQFATFIDEKADRIDEKTTVDSNNATLMQRYRVNPDRQPLPLAGKLAVITGAGSGIGRATAVKFAENGADIVCVDINGAAAERTALLCRALDAMAWARVTDVGSAPAMEALAQWVEEALGGADIVVNNAGIGMAGGMLDTSVAEWDKLLKVNLWGVIHGSRLFARQMINNARRGSIVNVASAAAFAPNRKLTAYSTSKAAVHMLTECLRAELSDNDIGVTAICPGFVATGIAASTVYAGLNEAEQAKKRARADALYKRRNFSPEQVADAVFNAVLKNPAVALVGAEAWTTRLLSRFAPDISRLIAKIDLTA